MTDALMTNEKWPFYNVISVGNLNAPKYNVTVMS